MGSWMKLGKVRMLWQRVVSNRRIAAKEVCQNPPKVAHAIMWACVRSEQKNEWNACFFYYIRCARFFKGRSPKHSTCCAKGLAFLERCWEVTTWEGCMSHGSQLDSPRYYLYDWKRRRKSDAYFLWLLFFQFVRFTDTLAITQFVQSRFHCMFGFRNKTLWEYFRY